MKLDQFAFSSQKASQLLKPVEEWLAPLQAQAEKVNSWVKVKQVFLTTWKRGSNCCCPLPK
jgi:hypothetical protein